MYKSIGIYFFVFLISIISAYLYQNKQQKQINLRISKNILLSNPQKGVNQFLIIFFPLFLATVRVDIGTDYKNYLTNFLFIRNNGLQYSISQSSEYFYVLLNYLGEFLFSDKAIGFFFLASLFTLFFVIRTLDYYKKDLVIALGLFIFYMYFYILSFNIVRQMIAVVIILFGYKYVMEKKPIKYVITVLSASFFHQTAIICLLFYFISFKKGPLSRIKNILFYSAIILSPLLLPYLLNLVGYIPYLNRYVEQYELSFTGYDLTIISSIAPIILPGLILRNNIIKVNPKYEFLINLSLLSLPLYLLSYYQFWMNRLVYYVSVIQIVLIPIALKSIKEKSYRRLATGMCVLFYIVYFIYIYIVVGSQDSFPYKSIIPFLNTK